jgi:hypothetical protein
MAEAPPVRRIVTGHDPRGKAIVLFDSSDPYKEVRPRAGVTTRALWMTESTPAQMDGSADRAAAVRSIAPLPNGSIFRVVDFPSMTDEEMAKLDLHHMADQAGQSHAASKYRPPTHPFMHRTTSVDYAIVMSGEIDMLLDDGVSLHVKAGDVVVQQGTNHAWINRTGATCRVAFVLIGAQDPFA